VEQELPEATVQQLSIPEFPQGAGFKVVTASADRDDVEAKIKSLFSTQLAYHHMTHGELATIDAATSGASDGPALTPPVEGPKPNDNSALSTDEDGALLASSCDQDAAADGPADGAKSQATTPAAQADGPTTEPPTGTAKTEAPKTDAAAEAPATTDEPTASGDSFAGGTLVTLNFKPEITYRKLSEQLQAILQPNPEAAGTRFELSTQGYEPGSSQAYGSWNLRVALPPAETAKVLEQLDQGLANAPFFPSSEVVGAAVADSAQQSAVTAMVISLALVLAYIWFRFQNVAFGFAAIVALVHDVLFTVGCLALSKWLAPVMGFALVDPFKIDLTIVAAILTIIGYSLNDTIVIFDRIREVRGKSKAMSADLINQCVNQTLSRTILTSLTVFLVVVILYVWGGPGIHGFAFALVVGTISGTYSTIYVASPVLLWLHQRAQASARTAAAASHA
jgi:SecD/SecF fusion protein